MYKRLVPVDKKTHAATCIKPLPSYAYAAGEHLVPALPAELANGHALFPIVFLEGEQVAPGPFFLLGPAKGRNLFISSEGKWTASYVPAALRRYPFALAPQKGSEEMVVCVDQDSEAVTEEKAGSRLFNEEGEPGPALTQAMQFLKEFQKQAAAGAALGDLLRKHDLLSAVTVSVPDGDARKQVRLEGVAAVDEQKLNSLEDTVFLELRQAGALPLVYMHLLSQRVLQAMFQNVTVNAPAPSVPPIAGLDESEDADAFDFSKI